MVDIGTGELDGQLLKWAGLFHYGIVVRGIVFDGSLFPSSFIFAFFPFFFPLLSFVMFKVDSGPTN